ncbi:hypothetical protein [Salinifilum ghardaiensis]
MKWLRGGWNRADWVEPQRTTTPQQQRQGAAEGTRRYTAGHDQSPPAPAAQPPRASLLSPQACDVDVSSSSFRLLLVGGGTSGLLTVLCAAALAFDGHSAGVWIWQLVFGIVFVWFVISARGMLNSRGFLLDHSGLYVRTRGEVFGVPWQEISAVGVGALPWVENRRPVHPERRVALEFYPTDPGFAERHPDWERWRVVEPPSVSGTPGERYRFHLPPFSRVPKQLERAVRGIAPRTWIGQYRRHLPPPPPQEE